MGVAEILIDYDSYSTETDENYLSCYVYFALCDLMEHHLVNAILMIIIGQTFLMIKCKISF
ncbi:hypothetical protein AY601_1241 [Pedobacter cryoconitis]|uniref:Uncharacterized protein n=1 Tax=Pedobacter cryoconitis TaxID=188932 RepID=A0A127VA24_9SPHI|nr:hypothetical protein AY601_1241 [Pedobacter cryoconitis]